MIDFEGSYGHCRRALLGRLAEKAPSRVQIVTGPRQVGKTTLLLAVAAQLGARAEYAACDGPEASLPGFWERIWRAAQERASAATPAIVLLDEVQHVDDWASRLKGEWDRMRRTKQPVHVVATGSSALRLGAGSRESLAGRFERLALAHWSASALASTFGLSAPEAAELVVMFGGYPGALPLRADVARWRAYVRDAIVEPAIATDILALADVRRPALLRQVFAVAAASPAQIVSLQKLQGQLREGTALETIAHYLHLLEEGYLVAALEKHSARATRRRAAPPKLVTLDNALVAVVDARGQPDPAREADRFGAWVENACLAFAYNAGQRVTYWREEPLEVDAVVEGSWGKWAIEVKTGSHLHGGDLSGLAELTRREPAYRPLVVCDGAQVATAKRLGMRAMEWREFLISGPPS